MTTPIELVVLDMAGTTVVDDGVVEQAFQRAAERTGVAARLPWDDALGYVRKTMGQSKLDVFLHLADGDAVAARQATAAFEAAYAEIVAEDGVAEIPGAADAIQGLKDAGLTVALTTGFAPVTRQAILDGLGWGGLIDLALSPVDAGRGRPAPDLVLTALLRTGASAVQAVAVAGDTVSDVESGRRAGAGFVAGVLTGAHDRAALSGAGAHAVLSDVTALRGALAQRELLPAAVASV
ncbi:MULTISPECIES: HAD family hydrolase [unclassified Microbacterium]|uniref:HAD family hydrolase n=1 Tax=unclassified Microbacterium TaxID=2609290 RepID=UPI0024696EB4|nr:MULTISPECIES: HAD family hydrolase [unclassified Microbacterium]MDH5133982.1 HAD hydrolase-like protein [Microbacterium sp. RD10]MDH5136878.1 HAD hydrolase-like protein [Microbacterium sp. RD11]MDH5144109.1 HAD hydrolase-like protein [Microbacterium sp. RD12]MDH5153266.1 HAD hydrolase-like protein [Microbacterium sp. RD06]MDH5166067.1 HAD hydrolase-like protein [Microbacterium sp. RD02]